MNPSWWFLGVSIYGALFTLNAHRPFRFPAAIGAVFFASWLTIELALHHIAWQAVATAVFISWGALDHWPGWVGLAITVLSWLGLAGFVRSARGVREEVETALREGLGPDYRDGIDPELFAGGASRFPRSRVALAFYFGQREVRRASDISYGPYGRRNRLDVWHHRDGAERAPVLIWIHGGAWFMGHKGQQALPMLTHLTAQGWVCVSPNYRLAPRAKFPDYLVDVKRALAWTKEHVAEYGGDPDFIVVTGGSAGGNLAALTALTANDPEYQPGFEGVDTTVQGCVPFYGIYDTTNRFGSRQGLEGRGYQRFIEKHVMGTTLADDPQGFAKASPVDRVHPDAPPFFLIHGTHDVLAPLQDAQQFATRLRKSSREPVAFAELRGAQHAFETFHSIRTVHVVQAVERFALWVYSRHRDRTGATTGTTTDATTGTTTGTTTDARRAG